LEVAFRSPWPLRFWAALILFSQTTWAGRIASVISAWLFGPGPADVGSPPFLLQKAYHCFLFGVFGWMLARTGKPRSARSSLALAIGFGVIAECLQLMAPGRHPQLSDAAINVVSATAAWALSRSRPTAR
jgi:VanZ family protein